MSLTKSLVFLVLVLAVILTLKLAGVFDQAAQSPASISTPIQTPTPSPAPVTPTPTLALPTPAPTPAREVSFPAAIYTNDEYDFTVQYPKEWVKMKASNDIVFAAFQAPTQAPIVLIGAVKKPAGKEAAMEMIGQYVTLMTGSFDPKSITGSSDVDSKLADGTTCKDAEVQTTISGFPVKSFATTITKGSLTFVVFTTTVDIMSPYNKAQYTEIGHSLKFK